jgi:mono/diheme cytochrome c family protein
VIRRLAVAAVLALGIAAQVRAHDVSTTPITWNREIARIVYDKCASCHRPGGTSFSLMTYPEVQPRAVAIRDAVLSRRMPPWGAVKGFGDFRNDQALTAEQIELITDWVQDDTPKGNNARMLPQPPKFKEGVVVGREFADSRQKLFAAAMSCWANIAAHPQFDNRDARSVLGRFGTRHINWAEDQQPVADVR